jgi:hypothetical protein
MTNFKHVFNAQYEYMTNNKDYIILETTLTDKNQEHYENMVNFCDSRITDSSWSIGLLEGYSTITIRLWDKNVAEEFKSNFSKFLK